MYILIYTTHRPHNKGQGADCSCHFVLWCIGNMAQSPGTMWLKSYQSNKCPGHWSLPNKAPEATVTSHIQSFETDPNGEVTMSGTWPLAHHQWCAQQRWSSCLPGPLANISSNHLWDQNNNIHSTRNRAQSPKKSKLKDLKSRKKPIWRFHSKENKKEKKLVILGDLGRGYSLVEAICLVLSTWQRLNESASCW